MLYILKTKLFENILFEKFKSNFEKSDKLSNNFFPETSKVVVWDEVEREVCQDALQYGCFACIADLIEIGNTVTKGQSATPVKGYQNCTIKYKEEPLKLSRGTTITSTETVCEYVDETHCEFRWVLEDNGDKTWKEDPDTWQC